MLEEVGVDYDLEFVDIMAGGQKAPELVALNPMGKLPILTDGEAVVTEAAAIGLYLADRYALGRLAPKTDDPARATYLRWSLFAPSVIEPGTMAKAAQWEVKAPQAGWGTYDAMIRTMEFALEGRNFILGDTFSMADVIFGATLRFMLNFEMVEPRASFVAYAERLALRPALHKAEARNAAILEEHGIKK